VLSTINRRTDLGILAIASALTAAHLIVSTMEITAHSAADLLAQLSRLDIRVPPRTEGRTTKHTERYAAAHLLSALSADDLLSYPLTIVHRDRPDFALLMRAEFVGIEHTEAVPQNDAHRSALRERGYGPPVYFLIRSIPTEPRKSAKRLIAEVEGNYGGPGWTGDSVECEWASAMIHFVKRKIEAMSSPGFEIYRRHWLLVYDNWPVPAPNRRIASQKLHVLCEAAGVFTSIEKIFVMSSAEFCSLCRAGVTLHAVNDLWES
jgi:hypothetical protein